MVPAKPPGERRVPSGATVEPAWLARLRRYLRIDLAPVHRQPSPVLVLLATATAVVVSLVADELMVHFATTRFATTRHFVQFAFSDYGPLTIVGVLLACAAWPVVTRVSSAPRRLFFRLAVVVTAVLWLPDVWLLAEGETARGVSVLMAMHLVVALVTYNLLVHVSRVRRPSAAAAGLREGGGVPDPLRPLELTERMVRRVWSSMALVVAADLALGVATIVSIPFRRPNSLFPGRATWLYAAHAAVGIALVVGAAGVLLLSSFCGRIARIGAVLGAAGIGLGALGGVFASFLATRLLGMGLMLLGTVVAGVGYMAPSLDAMGRAEAARAESVRKDMALAEATRRDAARARAELERLGQEAAEGARPNQSNGSSVNGHGAGRGAD